MNKRNEIKANLVEIITESQSEKMRELEISKDGLTDDLQLIKSGLFDSLGFLDFIAGVENNLGMEIDFSDHDPEDFSTLGGFIRCLMLTSEAGE